jgi:hypothetical protein
VERAPTLPLSYPEALRLAARSFGNDYVVVEDQTIERSWGWVFSATSPQHARSGALEDMIVGLGCTLVDRLDGSVHSFDSSGPPSYWADEYERRRRRRRWLSALRGLLSRR